MVSIFMAPGSGTFTRGRGPEGVRGRGLIRPPFGRVMVVKPSHLGDLVISLPMAAALKRRDPACTVVFLASTAATEVARCCPAIDEVVTMPTGQADLPAMMASHDLQAVVHANSWPQLLDAAHMAGVPARIGSLYRLFNLRHCTHLVAVTRASQGLNKRELDLQLLSPFGIDVPDQATIAHDGRLLPPPADLRSVGAVATDLLPRQLARGRHAIVLSAASVTAASHCWPWQCYAALIRLLGNACHWFICGLASEREQLRPLLNSQAGAANVTDLVGKLGLRDFMRFVAASDGLIGGSSGPLHLAAALGVRCLGLYQSGFGERQRWRPLGSLCTIVHSNVPCRGERSRHRAAIACPCIMAIDPAEVAAHVSNWLKEARAGPQPEAVHRHEAIRKGS